VDFSTGKLLSAPSSPVAGAWPVNLHPKWSRDGRFAYLSPAVRQRGPSQRILTIQSSAGETSHILPLALAQMWTYDWSPDGRWFLTRARDLNGQWGIFRIDGQSGEVRLMIPAADNAHQNFMPRWTRSSTGFFYMHLVGRGGSFTKRDLATGRDQVVIRFRDLRRPAGGPATPVRDWTISPDERYIAAIELANDDVAIWLISIADKTIRQLIRVKKPTVCCAAAITVNDGMAWTPDSRAIVFNKGLSPTERELWVVGIDGAARKLELGVRNILDEPIAIHPDGRQIAFMTGTEAMPEMRLLERLFVRQ
jgi:Tol biopolymer transport system component